MSALPSQLEAATTVLRRVPPTCSSRRRRRAPQGTMTRCSPTGREAWRAQIGVHAVLVPQLLDPGTYDPTVVNLSAWGDAQAGQCAAGGNAQAAGPASGVTDSIPGLRSLPRTSGPPGAWVNGSGLAGPRHGEVPTRVMRAGALTGWIRGPGPGHRQIGCEAVDADLHGLADRRGIGGHPVVGAAVRAGA